MPMPRRSVGAGGGGCGNIHTVAMAKAIHSGRPFKTVLGTLTYDAKGDVTTPDYQIYVWKRGYEDQLEYDESLSR